MSSWAFSIGCRRRRHPAHPEREDHSSLVSPRAARLAAAVPAAGPFVHHADRGAHRQAVRAGCVRHVVAPQDLQHQPGIRPLPHAPQGGVAGQLHAARRQQVGRRDVVMRVMIICKEGACYPAWDQSDSGDVTVVGCCLMTALVTGVIGPPKTYWPPSPLAGFSGRTSRTGFAS
jgi:hypothetical protein